MQPLLDLYLLVDRYAILLPNLDLDGDDQEELSTVLLHLQNQVERGTPNQTFVDHCLNWLQRFTTKASPQGTLSEISP